MGRIELYFDGAPNKRRSLLLVRGAEYFGRIETEELYIRWAEYDLLLKMAIAWSFKQLSDEPFECYLAGPLTARYIYRLRRDLNPCPLAYCIVSTEDRNRTYRLKQSAIKSIHYKETSLKIHPDAGIHNIYNNIKTLFENAKYFISRDQWINGNR